MPVAGRARTRAPPDPAAAASDAGSMRGPVTTTMRSPGTRRARLVEGVHDPAQQVAADAGAADGHHADPLVRAVTQLGAQRLAVGARSPGRSR